MKPTQTSSPTIFSARISSFSYSKLSTVVEFFIPVFFQQL